MCVKVKSGKINDTIPDSKQLLTSFISLNPIFTMLSIRVNNDIVDMPYDFGCHGNHFGGKLCVTIVTKIPYY